MTKLNVTLKWNDGEFEDEARMTGQEIEWLAKYGRQEGKDVVTSITILTNPPGAIKRPT